MKVEEKKQFLIGFKRMFFKLESLKEQKKVTRERMESAKAIEYSDMPKSHRKTDLSDCIVQLEEQEERINNQIAEIFKRQVTITDAIMRLEDGLESDIMNKHYIQFIGWEEIGKELGYSRTHILRLHGHALQHINL